MSFHQSPFGNKLLITQCKRIMPINGKRGWLRFVILVSWDICFVTLNLMDYIPTRTDAPHCKIERLHRQQFAYYPNE
jgi:hypothetical protein